MQLIRLLHNHSLRILNVLNCVYTCANDLYLRAVIMKDFVAESRIKRRIRVSLVIVYNE